MQAVRARFQLPLGAIAHPFAEPPEGAPLPVIQLENYGIIRCRRCRTYINPFMQWSEDGRCLFLLAALALDGCQSLCACSCNDCSIFRRESQPSWAFADADSIRELSCHQTNLGLATVPSLAWHLTHAAQIASLTLQNNICNWKQVVDYMRRFW